MMRGALLAAVLSTAGTTFALAQQQEPVAEQQGSSPIQRSPPAAAPDSHPNRLTPSQALPSNITLELKGLSAPSSSPSGLIVPIISAIGVVLGAIVAGAATYHVASFKAGKDQMLEQMRLG